MGVGVGRGGGEGPGQIGRRGARAVGLWPVAAGEAAVKDLRGWRRKRRPGVVWLVLTQGGPASCWRLVGLGSAGAEGPAAWVGGLLPGRGPLYGKEMKWSQNAVCVNYWSP